MKKGIVKFYAPAKLYGFITGEDGQDYYFRNTDMTCPVKAHDKVEFEIITSNRGIKASTIIKI